MSRARVPLPAVLATFATVLALAVSSIGASAGASGRGQGWAEAPPEQPNVVLFLTDDMREDDLAYAPYIRKFFATGVHFRNSYSTNPMCCPARASILTGRYSHNHKVVTVEPPWGFGSFDDRATIATAMKAVGYRTGYVGKYLNGYGEQRSKVTHRDSTHYVPAGWDEWHASLDDNSAGVPGGTYSYFDTTLSDNGRVIRNKGKYSTNLIGGIARKLAEQFRGDKPFFLYVNTVAPHYGKPREPDDPKYLGPYTPARPNWVKGRFDKMLKKSPGVPAYGASPEADVRDKTWPIRSLPELGSAGQAAVRELARQRAETIFVVDQEFRRLISTLRRTGELADTVVIFSSDNGHFLGEHRKPSGKLLPYEPSFRVPMLIKIPGAASGVRYDPVGSADLGATLLDLTGSRSELPLRVDGRSFLPQVYGDDVGWVRPAWYEAVIPAMNSNKPGLSAWGIRTSQWKFVMYTNGKRELYNLIKDPHELRNLVYYRQAPGVLADLTRFTLRMRGCSGKNCWRELPAKYRRTPRQAAKDWQKQQRRAWFPASLWLPRIR